MPPANADTLLAFDVGLKRTGVAVGSIRSASASPETTLTGQQGQLDWTELDRLLNKWQPSTCIVGDPKTENPHLNKLIRRLVHRLQQRHITVVKVDETLTSVEANNLLVDSGVKSQKKRLLRDQVAASLILQRYLETHSDSPS